MLQTQGQLPLLSSAHFLFPTLCPYPFSCSPNFLCRPSNQYPLRSAHNSWIAQLSEEPSSTVITAAPPPEEGPVELSPSITPIFATSDEPTTLQTATSVLLTGAITVFLFRSLRRRAKRAKETKLRSSGEKKSPTVEAAESLKSVSLFPVTAKSPPSPVQVFLGALAAGVIALILYKFTSTIESALNRQTISDNYSVRQITVTIRTIINGLCYLATFVFGANSLGLFLYSGQLAFDSFMKGSSSDSDLSSNSKPGDMDSSGITSASEDQSQENAQ